MALCVVAACLIVLRGLTQNLRRPLEIERQANFARQIEDLWPHHAQHFPQLRQTLILIQRGDNGLQGTGHAEQEWHEQRRDALAVFLRGLGEDFARLGQIVKILESVSPLTAQKKRDVISCQSQFRINYRIAAALIATRWLDPTNPLNRLTEILANISALIETRM